MRAFSLGLVALAFAAATAGAAQAQQYNGGHDRQGGYQGGDHGYGDGRGGHDRGGYDRGWRHDRGGPSYFGWGPRPYYPAFYGYGYGRPVYYPVPRAYYGRPFYPVPVVSFGIRLR